MNTANQLDMSYRERVIQFGESPERVFNIGAMGIDNIKGIKLQKL